MPPTTNGIISVAAGAVLGVIAIFANKHQVNKIWNKDYLIAYGVSALISAYMGIGFYERWFYSSKVNAIASWIGIPQNVLMIATASVLAVCSIWVIGNALGWILKILRHADVDGFFKSILCAVIAAYVTVISSQGMLGVELTGMGMLNLAMATLIVLIVILFWYALFGRITLSVVLGITPFFVLSTANVYMYLFRDRLLEPIDFLSIGTAANVADNYSLFPIPGRVLCG